MGKWGTWVVHALASIVAAIAATGAVYYLPARYQPYAIAVLGVLAYLLGVKMPTPGANHGTAPLAKRARDPLRGPL